MEYIKDLFVYIAVVLVIVAALLLFVFHRVDMDWRRFKEHWKTTGDGAASGILAFVLILAGLSLLSFWANSASADWFKYTEVYAGIDRTFKPSPQCERNAVDDRLTSNGGVRQHIYSFTPRVSILGNYTHHSCAVGVDSAGYDAAGIQLNWRFER